MKKRKPCEPCPSIAMEFDSTSGKLRHYGKCECAPMGDGPGYENCWCRPGTTGDPATLFSSDSQIECRKWTENDGSPLFIPLPPSVTFKVIGIVNK